MERGVKIHCITNPVTMQDVANLILAAGGTAIMAQDPKEAAEITAISSVTLINTGVPDEKRWEAAMLAGKRANREGHPVILDPVGAGASAFRREYLRDFLRQVKCSVIRCNQEEAAVLLQLAVPDPGLGGTVETHGETVEPQEETIETHGKPVRDTSAESFSEKPHVSGGVESGIHLESSQRRGLAKKLARACGCTVYISGTVDVVSDGKRICEICGGDDRVTRITGSGCMLSALCAVFAGEEPDAYLAACRAGRLWRECAFWAGRVTDQEEKGMGSFHTALLDAVDRARNFAVLRASLREKSRGEDLSHQRMLPSQLRVYAVTSENWLKEGEDLTDPARLLLEAGVTCVQLREKEASDEEIVRKAQDLKELCHLYRVPLIVNDRPDLALAAGADGVHVGLSDMGVEKARELLGEKFIIGSSAHNVEEALAAQSAGADYIGCGAVFGSTTKKNVTGLPMDELKRICQAVKIPVVAIGGITTENAPQLQGTGIAGAAVVSALFAPENKGEAVKKFLELFDTSDS